MSEKERIPVGRVGGLVFANVAAVIGSFAYAAITAAQLPGRYPVHFNAAGQPDRWATAGSVEWYVVPIIAAVMAATMAPLALLLPRIPMELMNLPRKEQFLRLGRERQTPILQYLVRFLLWVSLGDTLLCLSIQWMMFRAAQAGSLGGNWWPIVVVGIGYVALLTWGSIRIYQLVRRATEGIGVRVGVKPPSEAP
ncbi:MAG: DUF1648 domain-containing protein [bacterium]